MAGALNVLDIICIDTANMVPGPDGKHLVEEVIGRTQINVTTHAIRPPLLVMYGSVLTDWLL